MNRYARIASKITADIQENVDMLLDAAKAVEHVPGVKSTQIWDRSWDGSEGVIGVELPVAEWHEVDYGPKTLPVKFSVDPRIIVERVKRELSQMGLRLQGVKLPEMIRKKGLFGIGKDEWFADRNVLFNVAVAA